MSIDEAIENLNKVVDGKYELAFVSKEEQKQVLEWLEDYKRLVTQQPTAYDINNVVEELYMHSVEERIPTCLTHRIIDVEEAIEIVKNCCTDK